MAQMLDAELGARSTDRRAHPRVGLTTTATLVQRGEPVGRFMVQNLSAGGALLTGAPHVSRAAPVRLVLELPDGPLTVDAELHRSVDVGGLVALAVAFRHVEPRSEDRIQDAVLGMLDKGYRDTHPAVVVVDVSERARLTLAAELTALGHRVLTFAAPLGVVDLLSDPDENVGAVVVRDESEPGPELLEWIAETHARVRAVLLVEDRKSDPAVGDHRVLRCFPEQLGDAVRVLA